MDKYILYGHLCHETLPKFNAEIKAGSIIGHIGSSEENGAWFCHLHLQYMTPEYIMQFPNNLADIDGYSADKMPDGILDPMTI